MRQWVAIGAGVGLVAVSLPFLRSKDEAFRELLAKGKAIAAGTASVDRTVTPPPLTGLDLTRIDDRGATATAPAFGTRKAELTLTPKLQRAAVQYLKAGKVPEGAVVMTDVRTGRVLAYASVVENGPPRDLAVEAKAPSASVFKVVTGSALIEGGLRPTTEQCYSGGEHAIKAVDLVDDPKRDKWCSTLAGAMGRSLNTVFARLAKNNLTHDKLLATANRLGWGQELPFDVKVQPSTLNLPQDELGFARTAAGFWNSTLSPLQAANLATTVANGGEMIRLHVVASVKDDAGEIYRGPTARQVVKKALDPSVAQAVTTMMNATVESGTSYKSFHDKHGKAYLPNIPVAGKTGTLTKPGPDGPFYTWFVGFAPSKKPEVAISVLVANRGTWRVKATNVAADMLRTYFADKGAPGVRDPSEPAPVAKRR